MTQGEVHKLLKNIYKTQERAKKKQREADDSGDEEDEEESDSEDKMKAQPERWVIYVL